MSIVLGLLGYAIIGGAIARVIGPLLPLHLPAMRIMTGLLVLLWPLLVLFVLLNLLGRVALIGIECPRCAFQIQLGREAGDVKDPPTCS